MLIHNTRTPTFNRDVSEAIQYFTFKRTLWE